MPICSTCHASEARPNQWTCRDCHAEESRERRAGERDRLVRIESMLEVLLDERKPAKKAPPRATEEQRRRA